MELPNRKLPRLKDFDYSTPGIYFITICTHNKACIFGNIVDSSYVGEAEMQYSPIGQTAHLCLQDIETHYDHVKVDHWVIMPNHIHILIRITALGDPFPAKQSDISNIVGKYKAAVTRVVRKSGLYTGKVWQSSFYDHIVRNDADYRNIWQYISGNPSKWADDCFYIK